jgi:hypothetical protein
MEPNRLFLERCDQMRLLLESHKEIELLDLSAILIQLLWDHKTLVDQVNTKPSGGRAHKLKFRVGAWPPNPPGLPMPVLHSLEDGIDPETSRHGQFVVLTKDEFPSYPTTYFRGDPITVKEVVRYAANAAGGKHYDPIPKQEYEKIHMLSRSVGIGGLPLGVRQLKAIGRVTIRALYPLIEDVKKHS